MPEAIIETAIGLFFVFLLMSMVSSQIVEWIASFKRWRAKDLEKTIRAMLNDPGVKEKLNTDALVLADKLYAHPLIASLARPGSKPSYIPASKFTLALFDVILTAGTDTSTIGRARMGLEQVKNHLLAALPSAAAAELMNLLSQIHKLVEEARSAGYQEETSIAELSLTPLLNDELNAFLKRYSISPLAFNALIQSLTTDGDLQLTQIRTGVVQLTKTRPELSQLITSLFSGLDTYLSKGEPQLAAARRNVEQWFDETMDRAGGWYKRHTQLWLGIVGFSLALMLNVDAVTIATTLWRDPTLRQNVVEQARKYELPTTSDGTPNSDPNEVAKAIRELNTKLGDDLKLPIGWHTEVYMLQGNETCTLLPQRANDVWGMSNKEGCIQVKDAVPNANAGPIGKLVGLIITAMAISQGAPFWFDLLSKLINLRSSGAIPATSKEKTKE